MVALVPFNFQLGPWLAVEIPDLVAKGLVVHKDTTADGATNS